jgi:hypothetical protein
VKTVHAAYTARIRHWTLLLGVLQLTLGCLVGLIPPTAVEWSRGLVMAHVEFTANGVLMIVFALFVNELQLGPTALGVLVRLASDRNVEQWGLRFGGRISRLFVPADARRE